jgi:MoxR-like ATPase
VYCWIDYPDFEKEYRILRSKVPGASERLARQVAAFVQELRSVELYKPAGVSETLDWAAALVALDRELLDATVIEDTLGVLLKHQEDIRAVAAGRLPVLLGRALNRASDASPLMP